MPLNPAITTPEQRPNLAELVKQHHANPTPLTPTAATEVLLGAAEEYTTIVMTRTELAALKAELHAVHSDLGDASQVIFDLLERLKEREIELATERRKTERLEESVNRLKASVSSMKNRLAPILPVA